jgi:chemotaxis signal transduction protein
MTNGSRLDWEGARARLARVQTALDRAGERSPGERERLLLERAVRLGRRPETPGDESRLETLLIVGLGAERFAIPLSAIAEVLRNPDVVPAPLAPPSLAGVIPFRGEIRPVFHLSRAVNLPDLAPGDARFVLMARARGREAGLLVERVEDIRPAAGAARRPAPPGMPHVLWLTADLIPVLDPDRIFPEEMA